MLNSKQIANLKSIANQIDTIVTVGKNGINEDLIRQVKDALTAREIIKGQVLPSSPKSVQESADEIASETLSQVVQVIGKKFVLYKNNPEKNKIKI